MKTWRQVASETANDLFDALKAEQEAGFKREKFWKDLCEKATKGEKVVIYWHGPERDYRIRLVAEEVK